MALGDPLFFQSKGYIGFRGAFYFFFPRREAVYTARWLMSTSWKGTTWSTTICAFMLRDGSVWRIMSDDGRKVRQVVRGTPDAEALAGFKGAAIGSGL